MVLDTLTCPCNMVLDTDLPIVSGGLLSNTQDGYVYNRRIHVVLCVVARLVSYMFVAGFIVHVASWETVTSGCVELAVRLPFWLKLGTPTPIKIPP